MPAHKYRPFPAVQLPDRTWPSKTIGSPPRWCSVDLRDGNQALVLPMTVDEKLEVFNLLVGTGFKEIEVGFPSASQAEYDFVRRLIEEDLIPDSVTIQVLTQAREHLIQRTFASLRGVRRAVVHLYNSTSALQRRVVFRMDRKEVRDLAKRGALICRQEAEKMEGSDILFEYTPESFTGTETGFAVEVCEAVMSVWEPAVDRKVILNLPSTVEMATPNVYADQIEWFCRHLKDRDRVVISAHAHNDRGTAVAATELALMAGVERVEGTLFGNGERTGNVDILTLAMNLFSQGIDPGLDFSDIDRVARVCERCTRIPVHSRHPYAGELVYTAFSGSHQDAIKKGMKAYGEQGGVWEVPYLPIDPADVGRTYESMIRINSQSGKGGAAYIMESAYGFILPREMHAEFGAVVQSIADRTGSELQPPMLREAFEKEYLHPDGPFQFVRSSATEESSGDGTPVAHVFAVVEADGRAMEISGRGNGPIDAFSNAMNGIVPADFRLVSYHEHALAEGSDAEAAAYVRIEDSEGNHLFGVGVDRSIEIASFRAIVSAANRSCVIKDLWRKKISGRFHGSE
ncbi:MAG: 2-isopropylmalate synthase [Nitrospiraceae bacterium]|nr:2-isopropylmalate synthase [Nitrospiraceae bacterium]